MKIIYNVRHRYAIRLKFADKSLTFLTTLVFGNIFCIAASFRHLLLLT